MTKDNQLLLTHRYPTIEAIESRLRAEAGTVWILPLEEIPTTDADLIPFAHKIADLSSTLDYPQRILWIQPLYSELTLTLEEAEQLLGLVAGVTLLEKDTCLDGRDCYVVGGIIRHHATAFGLIWSKKFFKSSQTIKNEFKKIKKYTNLISSAIHFIELPENTDINQEWMEAVHIFVQEVKKETIEPVIGVCLFRVPKQYDIDFCESLKYLKKIEKIEKLSSGINCQIINAIFDLSDFNSIANFAKKYELIYDFSIDFYSQANNLKPYYQYGSYNPLDFDIRTPSFHPNKNALIEIPHVNGLRLIQGDYKNLEKNCISYTKNTLYRLTTALSRTLRNIYLEQLNFDSKLISMWHYFHVYNWASPPNNILHLLLFKAEDFGLKISLKEHNKIIEKYCTYSSVRFLEKSQKPVKKTFFDVTSILKDQVDLHQYLGDRKRLTPDGEKLIELLPEFLGKTLEIGSGYGLIASKIIEKTTKYIGVDLRIDQAQEINKIGGQGIISDIHNLPFVDNSFDTIIADNVIEHSYNPELVFKELRRVLHSKGRLYALIPLDYKSSDYQLKAHFWKADEESIQIAAQIADLKFCYMEVLDLSELNYFGCFPSCSGKTCLVIMEPIIYDFLDSPTEAFNQEINSNENMSLKINFDTYDVKYQQYKLSLLSESAILNFQSEINKKDQMLANLQAEVSIRDETLINLQANFNNLQAKFNELQTEMDGNFFLRIERKCRSVYQRIKNRFHKS